MRQLSLVLISATITFALGYKLALSKRDALLIDVQEQMIKSFEAEQRKADAYKQLSKDNYQKYIDASEREPSVITERVYVKADCKPLPTDHSGSMADGAGASRAELHAETVKRITAVTDQAEKDVLKCRAKLHSLHDTIKLFNSDKK